MNIYFQVGCFNDIDHISPIIWKCAQKGAKCFLLISRHYDWSSDYRIHFLKNLPQVKIVNFFGMNSPSLYGKIFRKLVYTKFFAKFFLKKNKISACVSEWYIPSNDFFGRFMAAAHELKIPCFAVPHGFNVHLNYNSKNAASREKFKRLGAWANISAMNICDVFVVDSLVNKQMNIDGGVKKEKCEAWGSSRFAPEWSNQNIKICPPFQPKNSFVDKTKVVFFLPHWRNNVDLPATMSLIRVLAESPDIHLVVKEHTRGNGEFPQNYRHQYDNLLHVEIDDLAHSPALINWADIVINFGSSIGIDAVLQNKPLIYPAYLHGNTTIFDQDDACYKTSSAEHTLKTIQSIKMGTNLILNENKISFLKNTIYGGKEPHDILGYYSHRIMNSLTKPEE